MGLLGGHEEVNAIAIWGEREGVQHQATILI